MKYYERKKCKGQEFIKLKEEYEKLCSNDEVRDNDYDTDVIDE